MINNSVNLCLIKFEPHKNWNIYISVNKTNRVDLKIERERSLNLLQGLYFTFHEIKSRVESSQVSLKFLTGFDFHCSLGSFIDIFSLRSGFFLKIHAVTTVLQNRGPSYCIFL